MTFKWAHTMSATHRNNLRASEQTADDYPSCSCDCCDVVARRPDEVVAGASIKCAPSDDHSSDVCGELCAIEAADKILASSVVDGALEYQRFCFFECKPSDGARSLLKTQCLALSETDVPHVVDSNGEAMDPAAVYGERSQPSAPSSSSFLSRSQKTAPPSASHAVSASLLSQTSHAGASRTAEVVEPDEVVSASGAEQAATDGKQLADSEARDALTEAIRTRQYTYESQTALSGSDPYATIADIRKAAAMSEAASERAHIAEEDAARIFKEVNRSNWQIALDTTASEVQTHKVDNGFLQSYWH